MTIFKLLEDENTASDRGCPFCFAPRSAVSSGKIVVPDGVKNIPDKGYSFFAKINPTVFECSVCGSAWAVSSDGVVYPVKQKLLAVDGVKSMPASVNGSEIPTSIKGYGPNEYRAPLGLKFYTIPEELGTHLETEGVSEEENDKLVESLKMDEMVVSEVQHFISVDESMELVVISENDPKLDCSEWSEAETPAELAERLCTELGISGDLKVSETTAPEDVDLIIESANGDPIAAAEKMDELGLSVLAARTRALAALV